VDRFYRIKNWDKFQHYKDRSPPWIKLHRDLLSSETWVCLDDAGRVLAIASMMLAAATDNKIPDNPRYIRRVAYLDYDPDFAPLVECGFLEIIDENGVALADASTMLADARPEERRGEERRVEGGACAPTEYAFAGDVIRIDQSQADQWRSSFPSINLVAELQAADAYYRENPPKGGKWFFPVVNWLKRAEESKRGPPKRSTPGKISPETLAELDA
jgi:hypothetical protein